MTLAALFLRSALMMRGAFGAAQYGAAASWLFSSRRKALAQLAQFTKSPSLPNVRAKGATTVGRQARAVENVPCRRPGLVARRWRSA